MEKPDSLRAALVAAMPRLGETPEALVIFVDAGRLVHRGTPAGATGAMGYEWRYRLRLEFRDFTGSPDEIAIPLLLWLREHQPDRLLDFAREDSALGFAADIIDETTWDVAFAFDLTEAVRAEAVTGGWIPVRLADPAAPDMKLLADDAPLVRPGR